MARVRRSPGWKQSGDVKDFLPDTIEVEEREEEQPLEKIDLETLSKAVNYACSRSSTAYPWTQKHDLAWEGAVVEWLENDEASFFDVVNAAQGAISRDIIAYRRMTGEYRDSRSTGARFAVYWNQSTVHYDSYGLERMALEQVWEALDEDDQGLLLNSTLAASDREAAKAWGVPQTTYNRRLTAARYAAAQLWHDWETAPPPPRRTPPRVTHCKHGHDYGIHAQWVTNSRGERSRRCGKCSRISVQRAKEKRKRNQ